MINLRLFTLWDKLFTKKTPMDKILHSYGPDYNGQTLDESSFTIGPIRVKPDWQDSLKYTNHITGFIHQVGTVNGGSEDCVDMNNGANGVHVIAKAFNSQGKYVATIKGGSKNCSLSGNITHGGSEVDVDLGGWSDQSNVKTAGIVLDLTKGGGPVTVRVLNADKPAVTPGSGPYQYAFPHPDGWYHGICVKVLFTFWRAIK